MVADSLHPHYTYCINFLPALPATFPSTLSRMRFLHFTVDYFGNNVAIPIECENDSKDAESRPWSWCHCTQLRTNRNHSFVELFNSQEKLSQPYYSTRLAVFQFTCIKAVRWVICLNVCREYCTRCHTCFPRRTEWIQLKVAIKSHISAKRKKSTFLIYKPFNECWENHEKIRPNKMCIQ